MTSLNVLKNELVPTPLKLESAILRTPTWAISPSPIFPRIWGIPSELNFQPVGTELKIEPRAKWPPATSSSGGPNLIPLWGCVKFAAGCRKFPAVNQRKIALVGFSLI